VNRRLALLTLFALSCGAANAQAPAGFPSKPIKLVVPYGAGTAADFLGRVVGEGIAQSLGQPVVIDNRPGAGGNIGMEAVAKAPNDGYTLLLAPVDIAINPSLYRNVNYRPSQDFVTITTVARVPGLLVVPENSPAKSVKDLAALAKKGDLRFASGGNGSQAHFSGVMFDRLVGAKSTHVPYRSASEIVQSLLSDQTQFAFPTFNVAIPFVQQGKLRALAVTGAKRNPMLPDVPTMAEAYPPGFELNAWFGLLAPAGTPPAIVDRINAEVVKALRNEANIKKIEASGFSVFYGTPLEFSDLLKAEQKRWADVISSTGIRID